MNTKTYMAKPGEIKRKWYLVDAADNPLGRVASQAANILIGKHRPEYTPHVDSGDHVIIINADKVALTGRKINQKYYYKHSGYPGGLKKVRYDTLLKDKPERALYLAVKGMLPGNRQGRAMLKKLRVYRGNEHPHKAQKPEFWEISSKQGKEG